MRSLHVVADSGNKSLRSVHVLTSASGVAPGEIETCQQASSYIGEIETVQAVDSASGVKNVIITVYTPP